MTDERDRSHDTDPLADTHASASSPGEKKRAVHIGDVLGRYELVEEIGEGGMATVYRARDRELRRDVAIKVLFPHLARRPEVVRRFHREARAAAGLEHPNILRVYDVGGGEGPDPPYIVMELIRGHSLLAEIEQRGAILAEVAACIGALLADALAVAHAAGIIHRDVKPANVMVAAGGQLLLADFGVARLETEDSLVTKTGSVLGTPAYMSPEQASGDTATAKSDLYSLGATLYQLATGSLPYTGSPAKVLSQIAQGAYVPAVKRRSEVGPDLSRVIDRLMASDPAARPAKATEVAGELRAIATTGGFGDPTDELAAYFANPEQFVKVKLPAVVHAIVTSAERAVAEEKLPRAMALADRASALAPEDPAVTALVHAVTEGGKASRRRRLAALGAGGLLVAAGAAFGVLRLAQPGAAVVRDAAIDGAAADAVVAVPSDTSTLDAPQADAGVVDAVMPLQADAAVRRVDATLRRADAPTVAIAAPDAAEPPDEPVAPVDAAVAAKGNLMLRADAWCELTIDGQSHGRLTNLPIALAAGHHDVVCEQPGTNHRWTGGVEIAAARTLTVQAVVLGVFEVRFEVDAKIDGRAYKRGAHTSLKGGRHDIEVGSVPKAYFDLRAPCVVRDTPDPGCYPNP